MVSKDMVKIGWMNKASGMNAVWNAAQGMGFVGNDNNAMGGGAVVDGVDGGNPNIKGDANSAAAMGMYGDPETMQAYQKQMMQQQQAMWQQQQQAVLQQHAFQQQALMMQMSGIGGGAGGGGDGNKGNAWYTGRFDQGLASGSFRGNGFSNQNGMGGNRDMNADNRNSGHGQGSWDSSGSRGCNFRGGRSRARGRNGRRR